MPLTIDVPTSITLEQIRNMLDCIGLGDRLLDLRSFVADMDGVHVTLLALDEHGKPYANGNDLAEHTISIKLDRTQP